jgi:hypothetical protein
MNQLPHSLPAAVTQFTESCGREYEFPAGGRIPFLTQQETELLEVLSKSDIPYDEKVVAMSEGRDWSDCYSIVIFGIRLAVWGVRSVSQRTFRYGVLALAAGMPKLDWRDVLGALAIFEVCGKRLGIDFQSEIEGTVALLNQDNLHSILNGFFTRTNEMRAVEVMGFKQVGEGREFTFISKSGS